jgi:hypothetical protein
MANFYSLGYLFGSWYIQLFQQNAAHFELHMLKSEVKHQLLESTSGLKFRVCSET